MDKIKANWTKLPEWARMVVVAAMVFVGFKMLTAVFGSIVTVGSARFAVMFLAVMVFVGAVTVVALVGMVGQLRKALRTKRSAKTEAQPKPQRQWEFR